MFSLTGITDLVQEVQVNICINQHPAEWLWLMWEPVSTSSTNTVTVVKTVSSFRLKTCLSSQASEQCECRHVSGCGVCFLFMLMSHCVAHASSCSVSLNVKHIVCLSTEMCSVNICSLRRKVFCFFSQNKMYADDLWRTSGTTWAQGCIVRLTVWTGALWVAVSDATSVRKSQLKCLSRSTINKLLIYR